MALAMNSRQKSMFRGAVEGIKDIEDEPEGARAGQKKVKKTEKTSPTPAPAQTVKQNMLSQYFKFSQSPNDKTGESGGSWSLSQRAAEPPRNNNPFRMVSMNNNTGGVSSNNNTNIMTPLVMHPDPKPTASPVIIDEMNSLSFNPSMMENKNNENSISASNRDTPQSVQTVPSNNSGGGLTCVMCYEGPEGRNFMTSPCGHIACDSCWTKWLGYADKCPTCRKVVKKKRLIKLHF